jgi:hypothetical protein
VDITLNPQKITRIFILIAALLFVAHTIAQILILVVGDDFFYGFVPMFNFDKEKNAPTYFSSLSLAFISVLVALIAAANKGKRYFWRWAIMSAIFLFVSFDDLVALHEQLSQPLRSAFQLTGFLYHGWIVVYGIGVVGLTVMYARFIWDLPSRTRLLFVLAAGIFITGAVGLEMLGGHFFALMGTNKSLPYIIVMTMEESFEIAGAILFIYALLDYIQNYLPGLRVMLAAPKEPVVVKQVSVPAPKERPTSGD